MYVDNIVHNGVTLNYEGKAMQIQVYEKEIKRLNSIINELEKDIKDKLKEYNKQKYLKNPAKSKIAEFKEEAFDYMLYKLKELKRGE